MAVDPHGGNHRIDLAPGQRILQAQAGVVAGLLLQAHPQRAQAGIQIQSVLRAKLGEQGGKEGRQPVQAGVHAEPGEGGAAGLAVDAAALRGGHQRREECACVFRVGQGRGQRPVAKCGDRLGDMRALFRGVVGFFLHVLAAEQHQGADGLVDIAISACELSGECRVQFRFGVLFL